MEAFHEEYMAFLMGKEIPRNSSRRKLRPWLDDQCVLRCGGRLQFTEWPPYDVRFAIKLPRGQWRTRLAVKHYHELSNRSAGTNFVLSQISGRFWIAAAYGEVRA